MIRYQLGCVADHAFESWFRDSSAFDEQLECGLLACPVCGSNKVTKSIMAPAVVGAARATTDRAVPGMHPLAEASPPDLPGPLLDPRQRAMRMAMRAMRDKIMAEGHDVGTRFPKEARDMHDGVVPMRPIRGEATPDEARDLIEDGIMILPIPPAPEELN